MCPVRAQMLVPVGLEVGCLQVVGWLLMCCW
jgi:hypothetical protein